MYIKYQITPLLRGSSLQELASFFLFLPRLPHTIPPSVHTSSSVSKLAAFPFSLLTSLCRDLSLVQRAQSSRIKRSDRGHSYGKRAQIPAHVRSHHCLRVRHRFISGYESKGKGKQTEIFSLGKETCLDKYFQTT